MMKLSTSMALVLTGVLLALFGLPLIVDPDSDYVGFGLMFQLVGGACLGAVLGDAVACLVRLGAKSRARRRF